MDSFVNIILGNPISFLFIGIVLVGIVIVIWSFLFKKSEKLDKSDDEFSKRDLVKLEGMEKIKKDIFQLYKDIEIAKMKFRFAVLEEKLEKSLYEKLEAELKELKSLHQKQVSTDISLEELRILSKYPKSDFLRLEVFLHVSQYDYVIDKEKNVVRGTNEGRYQIEYKMVVDKNLQTNQYRISKQECVGKWIKK